ncbi:MAG: hypothetical protein IRZ31_09885 [Thermogemmatispora sp.]|uniref:AfsR/SARP family transcriptional regulator n=1 Tax=Thermogemmatispora sp. TaxID=1968838 RepID=UPI00260924FD|nr:bacterial transcriptional activator domain-containing protein [Thermogemmatispora sp.]MBX5457200.1 hypothetical protein [Thermogemmatispora sp.]
MATANHTEPARLDYRLKDQPLVNVEGELERVLAALQELDHRVLSTEQLLREASQNLAEARAAWQALFATLEHLTNCRKVGGAPNLVVIPDSTLINATDTTASLPEIIPLQVHPRYLTSSPLPSPEESHRTSLSPLYITCFGHFTVRLLHAEGPPIQLCRNTKGQAILRYLLAQPQQRATVDMLMADLWRDEERESSRHKLQIAVSALRASLNRKRVQSQSDSYILYKEQAYLLNPAARIITDVAEFRRLFTTGHQASDPTFTAHCYEQACKLYAGPFLTEDLYAEWSFLMREELARVHYQMVTWLAEYALQRGETEIALTWTNLLLKLDRYDEEAYRKAMRAHSLSGRRNEMLRCYQQCCQTLREELGIEPLPETQRLFEQLMGFRTSSPLPQQEQ